jgi:hypothetical protein
MILQRRCQIEYMFLNQYVISEDGKYKEKDSQELIAAFSKGIVKFILVPAFNWLCILKRPPSILTRSFMDAKPIRLSFR